MPDKSKNNIQILEVTRQCKSKWLTYSPSFLHILQKFGMHKPLCCLSASTLYLAMIRDFHIAKRVEDIGFYAGFVGASYMFGRALTSALWGTIADRYGRKPVVIIGSFTVVLFPSLFGLSTNFWMAIITRFLQGSLNGLLASMMVYASEVSRQEYRALGLSIVTTFWGVGLIIGPALGGFLAQPAEKFPNIFSRESIFGRFPYFLPCLCTSIVGVAALIASFCLPETLHKHNGNNKEVYDSHKALEASSNGSGVEEEIQGTVAMGSDSRESLLKNWPLMSAIIVYCVFSLQDMTYSEIFPLWAVSPRKYGGLNYTTQGVGEILVISGCGLLVVQLFLFPMFEKILGPIMISRIAMVLSIPVLSSYPFIAMLSGFSLSLLINCASLLKNILTTSAVTATLILQNKAVAQHQRGEAYGIAVTLMSFAKAFGPAGGGALLSWAQKRMNASFLPGIHIVFFILNVIGVIGLLMTFKPFLALPPE